MWESRDWALFGKLLLPGIPIAVVVGAGLALLPPQSPVQEPYQPPTPSIIVVVPPTTFETETEMSKHARPEEPSTIAPTSRFAPETHTETLIIPDYPAETPALSMIPIPTVTATPEPTPEVTETPTVSETPIYDSLVQEFIGQDPSFSIQ